MDTPKSLFHRIKECQEITLLGDTLFMVPQAVNNTMHFFLQSRIFQRREFEAWDAVAAKTWPVLKKFVQGAYQRKLVALSIRSTTGQMGYVPNQNIYNILNEGNKSSVDAMVTHTATTAGATPGRMLGYMH